MMSAVLLGCGMLSVQAQSHTYYNTQHEVGISIGSGANSEILSGLSDFASTAVSATVITAITGGAATGYYSYGDESYIPTISAEYLYHVSKGVALGGSFIFNGMSRDMYASWKNNVTGNSERTKTGKARRRNISIMPMAKFDWLRKKCVGLYSKLGLGATFMHESQKDDAPGGTDYSKTKVVANFHVSLLGVEAGSEHVRAYAELGMGEQGILLAGLKYKF